MRHDGRPLTADHRLAPPSDRPATDPNTSPYHPMTNSLDDSKIQAIVQRVLREVTEPSPLVRPAAGPAPHLSHVGRAGQAVQASSSAGRDGVFSTVDDAVAAARAAFPGVEPDDSDQTV